MIENLLKSLRWHVSLGAKFSRVVLVPTVSIILLTLVSQLASLLASFLPLKVIILLGSESIPRYFPASFAELDRDVLIASLSVATVGFFLLYLLAERLVSWVTNYASSRLVEKSHKMVLFENQDQMADSAYHRYSRAVAGGVFIALAMFGLGWFYTEIVIVMIGYSAAVMMMFWLLYGNSLAFRERLESRLRPTLNVAGGIGFFVIFGHMIADFIFWSPPGFIIAIVTLLLSRQLVNRVISMVCDLTSLRRQRVKLDALFFHGKVLLPQQGREGKSIWPLLHPYDRLEWIKLVLDELDESASQSIECEWYQVGVSNVAGLRVWSGKREYLLKLYETNRSSLSLHEATLLGEPATGLPSCTLIGATQLQKFHCLLYELPAGRPAESQEVRPLSDVLRANFLAVEPAPSLVQRYQRSKPMLWQRLDRPVLEKLRVAVNGESQLAEFELLLADLPRLQDLLKSLPVALVNPDIHKDTIWVCEDGSPILLHWGRWALEPLGAGWPEQPKLFAQLAPAMIEAAKKRSVLSTLYPQHVELAALTFALERECNRQRFVQALELLPAINERLAQVKHLRLSHEGTIHG